ncbi:MAG: hypothetical protein IPJ11_10980 [Gemmatimonadetes bacterium]|nr:hypothetical protein [Gemmatimonadota bacterium]
MKPRHLADIALLTLAVQFGAQSPVAANHRAAHRGDEGPSGGQGGVMASLQVNTGTRRPSQLSPQ